MMPFAFHAAYFFLSTSSFLCLLCRVDACFSSSAASSPSHIVHKKPALHALTDAPSDRHHNHRIPGHFGLILSKVVHLVARRGRPLCTGTCNPEAGHPIGQLESWKLHNTDLSHCLRSAISPRIFRNARLWMLVVTRKKSLYH